MDAPLVRRRRGRLVISWYYVRRIASVLDSRAGEVFMRSVHLPRLRAIYLPNPKVAGSTIISTLVRSDGSPHLEGLTDFNSKASRRAMSAAHDPAAFWRALGDPNYFRFTFVRDPYARAASAYLDKIASRRQTRFAKQLRLSSNASFLDFLHAVSRQRPAEMNRHWRPQCLLISKSVNLSFLGRFETFERDFTAVKARLGVASDTVVRRDHGAGGGLHRELIGPQERALIEEIYDEDFRRFGYAKLPRLVAA
jgi:hypothetical protein